MQVNLFDSNFTQSVCSVAFQTPRYVSYVRGQLDDFDITLFTDEWINNPVVSQVQSDYKIGWLREPFCLHPDTYERSLDHLNKFDFILTYHEPFLKLHPKYRFAPYGGVWINKKEWGIRPKSKNISMLIGTKVSAPGHIIRREIADLYQEHPLIDFYGSRGTPVDYSPQAKLLTLADYHFSIITETCRENNLFTEWFLDALIVGTVPIFWGCPNLAKFFNPAGILSFDTMKNLDDTLKMIKSFGPETIYEDMLPAIRKNQELAKEYAITEDWLYWNVLRNL